MELIIGNKNYSSWSFRAWLLLSAFDLEFSETRIALGAKDSTSALAAYSEAARVPVLYDGELVIWDSMAICEYISEQYLDGRGWPGDAAARAEARACSAEMHAGFIALRESLPMNCRARDRHVPVNGALEKDIRRIDSLWSGLRKKHANAGPWLFGDFYIADCMYAPVVMRFITYNIEVSELSRVYMDTLLAHPQVRRWLEAAAAESERIEDEEVGLQA